MTREQALPIIGLCLKATVVALLVAEGAAARPGDIARAFRNVTLLARAFLAAHVAVPVITLLALWAVRPQQNVVVALAILASCPAAPLLIVRLSRAGGRPGQVMAIYLTLTLLALAVMPLTLHLMAQALGFRAEVDFANAMGLLTGMLVTPLAVGLAIGALAPRAVSFARPLARGAGILLVGLILAVTALNLQLLLHLSARSYLAIIAVVTGSLAAGHVLAPRGTTEQLMVAMLSAGRHLGVAVLVAGASFPEATFLPVVVPYLLVFLAMSTGYVRWQRVAIAGRRRCPDDNRCDDVNAFALTGQHPLGVSP